MGSSSQLLDHLKLGQRFRLLAVRRWIFLLTALTAAFSVSTLSQPAWSEEGSAARPGSRLSSAGPGGPKDNDIPNENNVSVQLVLDRTEFFVGDLFTVNVLVDGAEVVPRVELGPCEGLQMHGPLNGRPTRDPETGTYVFTYHALAVRPGRCQLGPVRVEVNGRTAELPSKPLLVQAPRTAASMQLQMRLSKTTCYVGEPLVLTVRWMVGLPLQTVKAVDLELPVLRDPRFDVFDPTVVPDKTTIGLPVSHTRVQARLTDESLEGKQFHVLSFEKFLRPRQPGRLTIPAATVLCTVLEDARGKYRLWNQYPSYFDNDFFEKDFFGPRRRVFAISQPVELEVRPLPKEGQPADFSGLVGRFQIEVSASPTEVPVGGPVTLHVRVSGTCPPECIQLPPLVKQGQLADAFEIPAQRSPGWVENGQKVFVQTVRPRHAGVTEIPPLELTWFDPQSARYGVCRSKPVLLKVTGERVTSLADAEGPASREFREIASTQQKWREISATPQALLNGLKRLRQAAGYWLWCLVLLPPLVCLVLAVVPVVQRRRKGNKSRRAAEMPFRRFMRGLSELTDTQVAAPRSDRAVTAVSTTSEVPDMPTAPQGLRAGGADTTVSSSSDPTGSPTAGAGGTRPSSNSRNLNGCPAGRLHGLLRQYLRERLQLPLGATTFADLRPRLEQAGVEKETIAELRRLLQALDAIRFGPPGASSDGHHALIQQAARTVERLERSLAQPRADS